MTNSKSVDNYRFMTAEPFVINNRTHCLNMNIKEFLDYQAEWKSFKFSALPYTSAKVSLQNSMTMLSGIPKEVFWNYMDLRYNSNFFGMVIDEYKDISVDKTLVMYLRYVCRGVVATDFIANVCVTHTQQG